MDEIPVWVRTAVWGLGAGLAFLAVGGGGFASFVVRTYDARLDRIEQTDTATRAIVDGLTVRCAETIKDVAKLDERVSECKKRIDANSAAIGGLLTDSRARPDPFTGADGRALRALIDGNERRLDKLERDFATLHGNRD